MRLPLVLSRKGRYCAVIASGHTTANPSHSGVILVRICDLSSFTVTLYTELRFV